VVPEGLPLQVQVPIQEVPVSRFFVPPPPPSHHIAPQLPRLPIVMGNSSSLWGSTISISQVSHFGLASLDCTQVLDAAN
jgi:hypothetical protein